MRLLGYLFAGWLLVGLFTNAVIVGILSPEGLAMSVGAAIGLVWLRRSYKAGSERRRLESEAGAETRILERRIRRLEDALPAEPLDSDAIVNAWELQAHEPGATERLRSTYSDVRRRLETVREELATPVGRVRSLEAEVDELEDYVRSIDALAERAPDLVDEALAEHADAASAVARARRDGADARELERASAKLEAAREALRKDDERPLDALRLATEAEAIARAAEEIDALAASIDVATERHAPAALAEVRGLVPLARHELDRANPTRARQHVARARAHLDRLEDAAASARSRVHALEAAIDEAGAWPEPAGDLSRRAREERGRARPDGLEVVARADRALRLGRPAVAPPRELAPLREDAQDARDELWAWALTASPDAEETSKVAHAVEDLLREADDLTAAGDADGAAARLTRLVSLARGRLAELESAPA